MHPLVPLGLALAVGASLAAARDAVAKRAWKTEALEPCPYCGCEEAPVSGDDVHPGYTGWPCCPNCGAV